MVKDMNAVQLDCMHLAVAQAQIPDVDPDDEMEFCPGPRPRLDVQQVVVASPGACAWKSHQC